MRSKVLQSILDNTPKDVEIFVDLYADIVVRINQLLREKGISKKKLAEKMDKNPSEISKWLSGEHNFTLRSLAKLSAELGESLIEVPIRKTQTKYVHGEKPCQVHMIVPNLNDYTFKSSTDWQEADELDQINKFSHAG